MIEVAQDMIKVEERSKDAPIEGSFPNRSELVERLRQLATGMEPYSQFAGVCGDIEYHCGLKGREALVKLFNDLQFNPGFPIQFPEVYYHHQRTGTLWSGKNGDLRRLFCRLLYNHLAMNNTFNNILGHANSAHAHEIQNLNEMNCKGVERIEALTLENEKLKKELSRFQGESFSDHD